jgi:hypothetical protein
MVWEPLSEALARILTAGFSNPDGQALICRAIAERKVRYRWRAISYDQALSRVPPETATRIRDGLKENPAVWRRHLEQFYPPQSMGHELNFSSPPDPRDFDWDKSRFKQQCNIGSAFSPHWTFVWIDVFSTDIAELLSDKEWLSRSQLKVGIDRRVQKARKWREQRIDRFKQAQRRRREWINIAEIAEWCSESEGSIVSNLDARSSAYEKLLHDLLNGDFEESGKSRVLFLHSWTKMAKMTPARMQAVVETESPKTVRSDYLDHCWIPRTLFQRWLATHNMPVAPPRFEASAYAPSASPRSTNVESRSQKGRAGTRGGLSASSKRAKSERRGRRGPAPGTVDRYGKADRALYPELERIMRENSTTLSAAALDLARADQLPGTGTPESRASRLAKRFRKDHHNNR